MPVKFKLKPDPTFTVKVPLHVPGQAEPVEVEFTLKHKPVSELRKLHETLEGSTDKELILDIAAGWELEDEFNDENIAQLIEYYPSAGKSILETYQREILGAREKN